MPAIVVAVAVMACWCDIWGDLGAATSSAVVDDFAGGLDGWQIAYSRDYYKGGFGTRGLRIERDARRGPTMVAPIAFHNTAAGEVVFITKTLRQQPRVVEVAAVRLWLCLDMRRGSGLESFIIRLRTSPRQFIDLRVYPGQDLPIGRWQQVTVPVNLSTGRNVWNFVLDTVKWLTLRLDDIDNEDTELTLRVGRIELLLRTPPTAYRPRVTPRPRRRKLGVLLAQHSSAGFYRLRERLAEALPDAEVDERPFRGLHFPLFWKQRPREELLATDLFVFLDTDPLVLRRREAEAIADAVASGAHLIVFGGPNSLNNSVAHDSPLATVLPVEWDRRGAVSPNAVPRPAEGAEAHPLAARVPLELTGPVRKANTVRPRKGSRVVLQAAGVPFVVTWRYKRGRATVVAGWHSGEDFFTGPGSAEWMRTLFRWAAGRLPTRWIALRAAPAEVNSGSTFQVVAELHGGDAEEIGMTAAARPEFAPGAEATPLPAVRVGPGRFAVAAPAVDARHLVWCRLRAGDDWLAVPVRVRPSVELVAVTEGGLGKEAYAPGQPVEVSVKVKGVGGPAAVQGGRIVAAFCKPRWPPRPAAEVARVPAAGETAVRFRMPPLTPGKWWLWLRLVAGGGPEAQTVVGIYAVRPLDVTDLFPIISFLGGGAGGHRLDRAMAEERVDDLLAHGFNTVAISGVPGPQQRTRLHAEAYAQARGMAVMYEYTNFSLLGRGEPTKPCVLSPQYGEALRQRLAPMIERARRTPRLISVKITDEPIANRNSLDDCRWCLGAFSERYGIELPGRQKAVEPGPVLWAVQDFVGEYVRAAYRASRRVLYQAYARAASAGGPGLRDERRKTRPAAGQQRAGRRVRRPWLEPFDLLLTYMSGGLGFAGRTIEDAVKWSEACDRIDFDVYPYFYPSSEKVRMLLAWPCFAYTRDVARHFGIPWGFYVEIDDRNWPFQKNPAEASSECAWTALAQGAMYLNTFIYRAFGTGNNARPQRWEHLGGTLRLVRALGPVLAHTRRLAAPLAVFEPSAHRRAMGGYWLPRYLFAALRAAAGGCDVVVEDLCIVRRTVDRPALVMVGVEVLRRDFAALLVRWVRGGGVLLTDMLPSRDERGQPLTLLADLGIGALPPPGRYVACGRGKVMALRPDVERRWERLFETAPPARLRDEIAALRRQLVELGIARGPSARGMADTVEVGLRTGEGIAVAVAVNHAPEPAAARLDLPAGPWDRAWLATAGTEGELVLRPLALQRRGGRLAVELELSARGGAAVVLGPGVEGPVAAGCRPRRVRPGEGLELVVRRHVETLEPAELQLRGPGGAGQQWIERRVALRGRRWTFPVTVPLDAPDGRYTVRVRLPMRGGERAVVASFEVSRRP